MKSWEIWRGETHQRETLPFSHLFQSDPVKGVLLLPVLLGVVSNGNEKEVLWDYIVCLCVLKVCVCCVFTSPLHHSDTLLHKSGDGGVFSVAECIQVTAEHVVWTCENTQCSQTHHSHCEPLWFITPPVAFVSVYVSTLMTVWLPWRQAVMSVTSDVASLFDALQRRPPLEKTPQFGPNPSLLRVGCSWWTPVGWNREEEYLSTERDRKCCIRLLLYSSMFTWAVPAQK